jgi:flavin-dependent dehydrogenase
VVIVGGGASGAHAAVKLRDMGKTVVLVEKGDRLVSEDTAVPSRLRDC